MREKGRIKLKAGVTEERKVVVSLVVLENEKNLKIILKLKPKESK